MAVGLPPYLELPINSGSGVPSPSRVQQAFKRARVGKQFHDSRTKIRDYVLHVEAWAKVTLRLVCGMGNRQILSLWAESHGGTELDLDSIYGRRTASPEVVFAQQIRRITRRIREIEALTHPRS